MAGAFGKRLFTLMRVEGCGYMHTATSQLVPTRKCRIARALIQGWSKWAQHTCTRRVARALNQAISKEFCSSPDSGLEQLGQYPCTRRVARALIQGWSNLACIRILGELLCHGFVTFAIETKNRFSNAPTTPGLTFPVSSVCVEGDRS